MAAEPNLAVVVAQVESLVKQLDATTKRLDTLTETLAASYVPRGEYLADRRGDDRRFEEIEKDMAAQAGFRRQVAAAVIVGFLLLAANIALAVARIPGAG